MVAILETINAVTMSVKERIIGVQFRKRENSWNFLCEKEFSFLGGNLYGIKCNHAECGWGISYLLAGRTELYEEQVLINEKKYGKGGVIKEGWYMGEGIHIKGRECNKTIRQQIRIALKQSGRKESVNDIIDRFELSKDRIDIKFSNLSWESWRASAAIGYAYGKSIFCFPWLDTAYFEDIVFNTGFGLYLDILRKAGKIILLPMAEGSLLEKVADQVIEINSSRFHEYKFINEFIENGYSIPSDTYKVEQQ